MPDDAIAFDDPLRPAASGATMARERFGIRLWRFLRREPLVHFLLLGGLIFAADRVVHPPPDDQHTIVVTKALRDSFIEGFDEDKEKAPTQAELTQMIDGWVASEILYREGKAMGVERGDDTIRDRIAFKLQLMIFNEINIPPATDVQLRQWFDVNRGRFDEPERVGFYITAPMSEANARAQLEAMRAGIESPEMRRQARAVLARPVDTLSASFGETFRESLLALPTGQWSVIQSREGWHLVRLDSHRPKQPAVFEEVRDSAERQYHTEETRKRAWKAVNRLKTKYMVRYE